MAHKTLLILPILKLNLFEKDKDYGSSTVSNKTEVW